MPAARQTQASYMREMMQRLRARSGRGRGLALQSELLDRHAPCAACPSKRACREWLDGTPEPV